MEPEDIKLEGDLPGNSLSFSKIKTFLTCGYKFHLRYVMKQHSAPTAGMVLGRAFHKGQEYGVKQMIEKSTPPSDMVTDFAVAHFEQEIKDEKSIEYDEKDPNESVVKDDLAKMSGPVFDKSVSKLTPISSEESFEVDIGGVLVRGRLDIKDKKDDGVTITELKSGTRLPELLTSFDMQQSVYQYSQKMVRGLRKIFAKRHQDKARNFSLTVFEKTPDPASLISDIIVSIQRIDQAIRNATIYGFVKTADLRTCSWCGYRKDCRPEIFGDAIEIKDQVSSQIIFTTKQEEKNGKPKSKRSSSSAPDRHGPSDADEKQGTAGSGDAIFDEPRTGHEAGNDNAAEKPEAAGMSPGKPGRRDHSSDAARA